MADIELIIKISEEDYKSIKDDVKNFLTMPAHKVPSLYKAIDEGAPLPANHGKIVDLGKIDEDKIDKDNPIITININGTAIEAVSLDYLDNLPDLTKKEK